MSSVCQYGLLRLCPLRRILVSSGSVPARPCPGCCCRLCPACGTPPRSSSSSRSVQARCPWCFQRPNWCQMCFLFPSLSSARQCRLSRSNKCRRLYVNYATNSVTTILGLDIGVMLGQRLRHWPNNIGSTYPVLAGTRPLLHNHWPCILSTLFYTAKPKKQ